MTKNKIFTIAVLITSAFIVAASSVGSAVAGGPW